MTCLVRKIEARDEARWRILWAGYCQFYEREPNAAVADYTWQRILEAASPVQAIVAEAPGMGVVGIANYMLQESTAALTPVCYLQDLYVDADERGEGIGEALIQWLVDEMKAHGWSRLYWHTKENNYRARGLYDKFTPRDPFVRYVINHPPG
ncbi:MAG: GNAT family N-acetyltransferase [Betaproteobacteria bacterium]|nr:GNAT family N-acetyltransferase [Betaproteobacteria bacterium]